MPIDSMETTVLLRSEQTAVTDVAQPSSLSARSLSPGSPRARSMRA